MKKRPILFILTSAGLGGAERVALDAMRALREHDLKVLLPDDGPIAKILCSEEIPFTKLEYPGLFRSLSASNGVSGLQLLLGVCSFFFYLMKLTHIVLKTRPRTIYSHGTKAHISSALLGVLSRTAVIWHMHLFPSQGKLKYIFRLLGWVPEVVIANSMSVAAECHQFSKKVETVYCAIDREDYCFVPIGAAEESVVTIGMVSVLAKWKGVGNFLEAAAPLLREHRNLRVLICGDEIYRTKGHEGYLESLKNFSEKEGISDVVEFLPFQVDVSPVYSRIDVLVHASVTPEPFGRVISEARLCNCAVIATNGGGAAEQIESGKTGLLVNLNDIVDLRKAISLLINDRETRSKLQNQGYDWVVANLDKRKFNMRIVNLVG